MTDQRVTAYYHAAARVAWHGAQRKWRAYIGQYGRQHYLGLFVDEVAAARAYDTAARERFGDYAYLNFPEEAVA